MEPKYDLFPRMCDRRDIVDFVREIEKYPCLYNNTLPEYANKVHNRRAWSTIAKKINTTVPDCRDKWRKIRISYMRSLKQHNSDKPPMRPYYLSEVLQFLRPFLKVNGKALSDKHEVEKDEQMEFELPTKHEVSSDSDVSDPIANEVEEDTHENSRLTFEEPRTVVQKPKEVVYIKQQPRNVYEQHRTSYSEDIETNPRKMFLLSLLPDVECFTEAEMRIFRREVIRVCDGIINRRI